MLAIRNTDGQWQTEQRAARFHCASCWQQLGVQENEAQPLSIAGFWAHSQTMVCAGIDRHESQTGCYWNHLGDQKSESVPIREKSIKICVAPTKSSYWNLLLFPQPLITCFLFFLYHPFNVCFSAQRLWSTLGTVLNIQLSVSMLCDLLSNLETFISGVLHWNSYIFYDYCYQNDSVHIGLYNNNDTWLDELLSRSQLQILIRRLWLSYWRVTKIVYYKYPVLRQQWFTSHRKLSYKRNVDIAQIFLYTECVRAKHVVWEPMGWRAGCHTMGVSKGKVSMVS